MGPYRTQKALILALSLLASPALAQQAGWHYSPLPGEGDRAALGCDRDATPQQFTCLAVRCEDDFSTSVHIHTSRPKVLGSWEMTLDRENASFTAQVSAAPYGGQFISRADWLLERIEQGTFIYLRHADDVTGAYAYIDLGGSLQAIHQALAFCAPRVKPPEPITAEGV
ncbi:hypothetical protein SAMN05428969_0349 [Devosia sp. YR412]|uniref:hypothetical protein n=1 Tax=Devosia sp. YR412 TaxID=1881030 RepID=UPI0008BEFCEF|nr:hypothetical protein [Devosia sp. YR412]SEP66004.1 hypothetical protein SAMN05428969_0349 [Devosia sp. YR412]